MDLWEILMKTYILSSNIFRTQVGAIKRLTGWVGSGDLHKGCKVYEVEIKKIYQPAVRKSVVLEEI